MLDSIYHNDIKITLKSHFCVKRKNFCHYVRNVVGRHNVSRTSGLSILLHGVISLSDATS